MASIAEMISQSLVRGSLHVGAVASPISSTASRWLDADREFNAWFLSHVKDAADDESVLRIVSAYGEDQSDVEHAWDRYRADYDARALAETFETSIKRLAAIRDELVTA
jgi:hypothetical protein